MAQVPADYRRLPGSERRPAEGTKLLGPAAPPLPDHEHWMATPPGRRTFITHDEFSTKYGAAQEDLDAVANFARRHGITVQETGVAGRTVVLSGTVAQMTQAF